MTSLGEKLTRTDVDVFMYAVLCSLHYAYSKVSYRKPVPMYLKWENDDIYDILWYAGARRNKSDKTRDFSGLRFPTNSKGEFLMEPCIKPDVILIY